jgi:sec-independent protein translocase protein TatA
LHDFAFAPPPLFGGAPESLEWSMFGFGVWEMLAFSLIVLLLFGKRLPGLMRSLGAGVTEFKKGIRDGSAESAESLN